MRESLSIRLYLGCDGPNKPISISGDWYASDGAASSLNEKRFAWSHGPSAGSGYCQRLIGELIAELQDQVLWSESGPFGSAE